MTKGMLIYIVTMGWTLIITGGIAYLFKKKRDFSFLNGFSNRSEEEKQYLEKSGYLHAIGNLFYTSFWILLLTFFGGLFSIPYAFGIGMTIFTLHILIGLVWVQRYEVPHKRKKMFWIMGSLAGGMILFVGIISAIGFTDNEIIIENDSIEVTGMYGFEWDLQEIERVELLDELPEVLFKKDGFAMTNVLKGNFELEEPYGKGLLFVNGREGPHVAITTSEQYVIISKKEPTETEAIYNELMEKVY